MVEQIREHLAACTESSTGNAIDEGKALVPEAVGLRLFDAPIVGVASADDPLFAQMREPNAVGPQMRMPSDWLDGACSVISYFFPISEQARIANRAAGSGADIFEPAPEWLHARIDGQAFILEAGASLVRFLQDAGYEAICPAASPGFSATFFDEDAPAESFRSNWSERHVAYIAGLGTFSLSKGLITERGTAGRFGSVVTSAPLAATDRPYRGIYDYCIECGACIARCPVNAISFKSGKDHLACYGMMGKSRQYYPGYLGCGRCQVDVPCESARP